MLHERQADVLYSIVGSYSDFVAMNTMWSVLYSKRLAPMAVYAGHRSHVHLESIYLVLERWTVPFDVKWSIHSMAEWID